MQADNFSPMSIIKLLWHGAFTVAFLLTVYTALQIIKFKMGM